MKKILSLLLISLFLVGTVSAQSADTALVGAAVAAFEQTLGSTSLHIEAQTITDRGGSQQGSTGSYNAVQGASGWNVSGSQTTTLTMQGNTMETTTSVIVLDGTVYMLVEGGMAMFTPPNGDGAAGGGATPAETTLPEGWYIASSPDTATTTDATTPMRGGQQDASSQISRALGALMLPVTAEAITAISELPGDTINGQAMRVLQISLDPQAVIDSGSALLNMGGGGFPGSGFAGPRGDVSQGAQLPDGAREMPPLNDGAMPPSGEIDGAQGGRGGMGQISAENVQITFAVYIGADDGLIHRVYSVIAMGGDFATTITTVTDFSAFGEPVEISAPL